VREQIRVYVQHCYTIHNIHMRAPNTRCRCRHAHNSGVLFHYHHSRTLLCQSSPLTQPSRTCLRSRGCAISKSPFVDVSCYLQQPMPTPLITESFAICIANKWYRVKGYEEKRVEKYKDVIITFSM